MLGERRGEWVGRLCGRRQRPPPNTWGPDRGSGQSRTVAGLGPPPRVGTAENL